jgi:uncharacterized RmlC-like cupin family protein
MKPMNGGPARKPSEPMDDTAAIAAPGAVSGWHHHDLNETSLYVVSGVLRLEFEGYDGHVDAEAGDFVHVPAFTVHRESNPADVPSVAVIARAGGGIPTVNVDRPDRDRSRHP